MLKLNLLLKLIWKHRFLSISSFLINKTYLHYITLLFLILLLTGCSTDQTLKYMSAIEQNQSLDVNSIYKDEITNNGLNVELALMEKGRIAQLEGDYSVSMSSYKKEIDMLRQRDIYDDTLPSAQISVGSVLVNDNMLDYRARLFEIELVYLYQSFNYLAKGSIEGALVEIRRADFLLNEAEKARKNEGYDDEYFRNTEVGIQRKLFKEQDYDNPRLLSDNKPESNNSNVVNYDRQEHLSNQENDKEREYENLIQEASNKSFAEMGKLLSKTKSSFLNPYVVYIGGVLYEISGDLNNAYISYKKALGLMPANPYLQQDVIRLSIKLNMLDDIDKYKSEYPITWGKINEDTISNKNGRLIVIYEDGWIERKKEKKISLGVVAVAYPVYQFNWSEPNPMIVSSVADEIGRTSPICYMSALTLRALKEEEKWRIIRQAARVAVKGSAFAAGTTMTMASNNSNVQLAGLLVMIGTSIYNNMSENADLRCWMTLPENVQILSSDLPVGKHKITFKPYASQLRLKESVPIFSGKTTLVWVVRVGPRLIYEQLWPNDGL